MIVKEKIFSQQRPPRNTSFLQKEENLLLKRGIWLYFLLLVFEGALRKWFLPALAGPLLVIRDPLALILLYWAWRRGLLIGGVYIKAMIIIAVVAICTTLLFGHGNLTVALYGARILMIQFPLIFVIGSVFNQEDVIKMGGFIMLISIPMAVLIGLQFYSPQSAWVNRGVGGDLEGAGFSGALGYFRPSATFSFTNGTTSFFSLLSGYVVYFWLHIKQTKRLLLFAATVALLVAIPFSISRSLLFQVGVAMIFAIVAISRKPAFLKQMGFAFVGGFFAILIVSQSTFFQTALEVFSSRYETASEVEGGLDGVFLDRFLGGMIESLSGNDALPFFGYGIGMGTNVGSQLLTGGLSYLIAEGEWGRLIGELGTLLGMLVIFLRVSLTFKITFASYRELVKGNMLPWMLLSYGSLVLLQGQWAQPTSLGFVVLAGGLLVASFNKPSGVIGFEEDQKQQI